ncbi:MAG: 16S rRNA (guanine(966)-N(2))-methyltransferase RsmD [Acidobacteriota bacterium]
MAKRGPRILGGRWRGRVLAVGPGTRPTEARVREAVFQILEPWLDGCRFLDLFAGSGAAGFEALSRGAREAWLVDRSGKGMDVLRRNRRELGAGESCRLLRAGLPRGLEKLNGPFDVVYADPPYDFPGYTELLALVSPLLATDGRLVLEHASRREPEPPPTLDLLERRRYGDSVLSFFARRNTSP